MTVIDVEQALCDWLIVELAAGPTAAHRRFVPETPTDLFSPTGMPCHVIERVGGPSLYPGFSEVNFDVTTYTTGPDPLQARAAALARAWDVCRVILLRLPGRTIGGVHGATVAKRRVLTEPTIRPFDSRNQVRRAQAMYQVRLHAAL